MTEREGESLGELRSSFAYGSRNDLSFKFLKRLGDAEAAEFIRLVFNEVGEAFDHGSTDSLIGLFVEWQAKAYAPRAGEKRPFTYDDGPVAQLAKPLRQATVGVVSSSGQFVGDEPPEHLGVGAMTQEQAIGQIDDFLKAEPQLAAIPRSVPDADLAVLHPGYDIRSVAKDPGVALPRDVLFELEEGGAIGKVAHESYTFVGACAQGLLRRAVGGWIERWQAAGIDALLLVPV